MNNCNPTISPTLYMKSYLTGQAIRLEPGILSLILHEKTKRKYRMLCK